MGSCVSDQNTRIIPIENGKELEKSNEYNRDKNRSETDVNIESKVNYKSPKKHEYYHKMKQKDQTDMPVESLEDDDDNLYGTHLPDYISDAAIVEWKQTVNVLISNQKLNTYALSKNIKALQKLDNLKSFILKSPAVTDLEKLWAIYIWITHNIEYDFKGFMSNNFENQDANSVLKNGRAVCAGFSNILLELCNACGIKCVKVYGHSKAYGYNVGETIGKADHTWNVVFVSGKYKIIDSTWGAGYGDQLHGFVKEFDPYEFLVPSEISIFQRFPESQENQYLSKPYTKDEFERLPHYTNMFFVLELKCITHTSSIIEPESSHLIMKFKAPKDVKVLAELVLADKKIENCVLVQRDYKSKQIVIELSVHPTENTILKLFSNYIENDDLYWVSSFFIKPFKSTKPIIDFCFMHLIPVVIFLFKPKESKLKIGTKYTFKVWVEALEVLVKDSENNLTYFKKESSNSSIWSIVYNPIRLGNLQLALVLNKEPYTFIPAYEYEVIN